MSRVMKFRCYDKKRKRMYPVLSLHAATLLNGGQWATVEGRDVIEDKRIQLQVQPENAVIMQWSGMVDVHGGKIYEGDILHHLIPSFTYSVVFDEGSFSISYKHGIWGSLKRFKEVCQELSLPFEVIGNIHMNPNLINKTT